MPHDDGIFTEPEWVDIASGLSLSPRQEQITRLIFQGFSDRQIAAELRITVPTVRTHLTRLFGRLGTEDRNGVVLSVLQHFRAECRTNGCPRPRCH